MMEGMGRDIISTKNGIDSINFEESNLYTITLFNLSEKLQ